MADDGERASWAERPWEDQPADGKPGKEPWTQGDKTAAKFGGGCLGLLLLIGGCTVLSSVAGGSDSDTDDAEAYVTIACREWVKERLKAPSTADFPRDESVTASGGVYTVSGSVDSQNSFGATVRSSFTCRARHDSEASTLVSLEVNG